VCVCLFILLSPLPERRGLFRTGVYLAVLQDYLEAPSLRTRAGGLVGKNQHCPWKVLEVRQRG